MTEARGNVRFVPAWQRALLWLVYLAAWTYGLLTPIHVAHEDLHTSPLVLFLAAKTLHVTAYAVLAVLSGWLGVPRPLRWLLLAALLVHGAGTEFLQTFVPTRHGSLRDVALDWTGIALGMAASWKWWRAP